MSHPTRKPTAPARLLPLHLPLDTREPAPYLLAVTNEELRLDGSFVVGPFAEADAKAAWALVDREFHGSGAFFAVLARVLVREEARVRSVRAPGLEEARHVLYRLPYFVLGRPQELGTLHRLALDAHGAPGLDEAGRLPALRDEKTARRALERADAGPAVVVRAVVGEYWHIHM